MIAFERTRDLALVRELIAGDARVYDAASDDSAPAREEWQPNDHPLIWYVVAREGQQLAALYTLIPQNAVSWEIHASRVFGGAAAEALGAIAPWLFSRTDCRRLVASIPATNRAAIRAARRAGFREYGRNPRAFLKRGQLVDLILLGISAG
jgi:RimJ/RimL family protein N-acetyltransferase